jgi:hypothetical protein
MICCAADGVKDFQTTQELDRLHTAVMTSDKKADGLPNELRNFIDFSDKRIGSVTQEAESGACVCLDDDYCPSGDRYPRPPALQRAAT